MHYRTFHKNNGIIDISVAHETREAAVAYARTAAINTKQTWEVVKEYGCPECLGTNERCCSDVDPKFVAYDEYWDAVTSGQDHVCVIQETPDGMGCVTCLYC